ncbi:pore-forming tail protein [Vibrio phage vB_VorS-PVo5]|nr:pore-forming tail protein [Vibrio phage vB_VorS-PVo5]
MANKLIEELIIKVKQQGAKPTEKAIKGVADALSEAKTANNAFNSSLERSPKLFKRMEEAAARASKQTSNLNFGFNSAGVQKSLDSIVTHLDTLIQELQDVDTHVVHMNNQMIGSFDNLANSLGSDLERVEDGLIDVRREAGKTGEALVSVGKNSKKAGRGLANSDRQGRNQSRTFGDLAKVAGPLPLLYANIAANVFALSEAFRVLSESASLSRLENLSGVLGANLGVPIREVAESLREASGYTVSFQESLKQAAAAASYNIGTEQFIGLAQVARRASVAMGVDFQDALNRVLRGTTKLEPELLDELGVTIKLSEAYDKHAKKLGVAADALSSYAKQQAYIQAVLEQSETRLGKIDKYIDPTGWERLGAVIRDNFTSAIRTANKALEPLAEKFATLLENKTGRPVVEEARELSDTLGNTTKIGAAAVAYEKISEKSKELQKRAALLTEAISEQQNIIDRHNRTRYFDADAERKANIERNRAFSRLVDYTKQMQEVSDAQDILAISAGKVNRQLGITSDNAKTVSEQYSAYEAAMGGLSQSQDKLNKVYGTGNNLFTEHAKALREVDAAASKLEQNVTATMQRGKDQAWVYERAGEALDKYNSLALKSAKAKLAGKSRMEILQEEERVTKELLDAIPKDKKFRDFRLKTELKLVNLRQKSKDLAVEESNEFAKKTEELRKQSQEVRRQFEDAAYGTFGGSISSTFGEEPAVAVGINFLGEDVTLDQFTQRMDLINSSLASLTNQVPGLTDLTNSFGTLTMAAMEFGTNSADALLLTSVGLQGFAGYLQMSASSAISAIDQQIAMEKKRDGKSKESVAKIAALEKKKVEQQKKVAKQQILISTAVAVMNAAANPWPVPAIPLMAAAALAGGLAYQQASSASSNMVSGASESTQASLTLGERSNKVDVSQGATRGELAYLRNESGTGSMQSFTPRANGGVGTPGNSIVVGEHGPEVITPLEPIQAFSAEESSMRGSGGYQDNRQLVVQALDTQSIMDRADEIFDAWGDAAYQRGYNKEKLY